MIETMVKSEPMDNISGSRSDRRHLLEQSADENDGDDYHTTDYGDSSRGSSAVDEEDTVRPSSLPNLATPALVAMGNESLSSHPPAATSVPPMMTAAMAMERCSPDSSRHPVDDASSSSLSNTQLLRLMEASCDGLERSVPASLHRQHPLFQCHLCSYSGSSRFHYNQHVNTHYNYRCFKCGFVASSEQNLKNHSRAEHQEEQRGDKTTDSDSEGEEHQLEQPQTNAQGKLKTFKCKQCDFVTTTKKDYWDHTKTHINANKMLKCPKCPFVTEYKHHLEYHVRNHFGSKPFRCTKCSYSCVNKSMLNSHMKSHSKVYQYRCADCAYATKYCHSLKLHLRKYGHNPDVVLNADGTPNPLPIIDVYGTRRGPKMKRNENGTPVVPLEMTGTGAAPREVITPPFAYPGHQAAVAMMTQLLKVTQQNPAAKHLDQFLSQTLSCLPHPPMLTPNSEHQAAFNTMTTATAAKKTTMPPRGALRCNFCEFVTMNREEFSEHLLLHAATESEMQQREQQIMLERKGTTPAPSPVKQENSNDDDFETLVQLPGLLPKALLGQLPRGFGESEGGVWTNQNTSRGQPSSAHKTLAQLLARPVGCSEESNPVIPCWPNSGEPTPSSPLDLSSNFPLRSPQSLQNTDKDYSSDYPISPPNSSGKSRRKGKAMKLDAASWVRSPESRGEDNSGGHSSPSGSEGSLGSPRVTRITCLKPVHVPDYKPLSPESPLKPMADTRSLNCNNNDSNKEEYLCQYCDMSFKEVLMYTLHMGYHGYQKPFKCNMCGQETHNKVDFFIHIARSSHT